MSGVGPTMTFYPVTTPEPWPPIFMYGARPLSLDGAQIERELPDELDQPRQRLRVSCPNGNSSSTSRTPEEEDADEQCLRADLFPADWYQTQGTTRTVSIFGGTYTPSEAPEKTWRCEMTEAMGEAWETLVGGDCSLWETPSGAADASTTTTALGRCDVSRQYVPVRLTAGELGGEWGSGASYYFAPTNANNEMVTALSLERCPDPTSLVGFVAASATAATSGMAGSATGSTSASSAGTASRGERAGPAALACVALACASVAGLLSLPL